LQPIIDAWIFFDKCRKNPKWNLISSGGTTAFKMSTILREVAIPCTKGTLGCPNGVKYTTIGK
jgi:hypothetical protein